MNSFLRSRLCRCCVCLILVLVLLISWSPIRAKAVGVDQFVGVAIDKVGLYAQAGAVSTGATVFAWVLLGLGLIVTTAQAIDLMNQYTEFTGELETSIYYYPDGSWSYGVDMGFLERVRNFLFDSGVVVSSDVPVFDEAGMRDAVALAATKPYACVVHSTRIYICYSSFPFYVTNESGVEKLKVIGDYYFQRYNPSWTNVSYVATNGGAVEFFGTDYLESEYQLGEVAPNTVTIPAGYPEWHTNARPATNPDTQEEITVLPIPLNPSADPETQIGTLTQPNIWQGTIADPMPDMQPDPNPDPGTNPGTGVPSDIGKYQIDLKDFFPFCIPFDLYRFFEILCAEPEAPVFHWEFNVFGELHSLDVDLSPWNPHAQLFRDAQVGLFIMGLLWITRKFIKW